MFLKCDFNSTPHNEATTTVFENVPQQSMLAAVYSYLPGLHLLGPTAEGHVGVAGARAIPLFLLDVGKEEATLASFPLATPVVKHLLDQLIIFFQQQFGLL